MYYSSTCIPSPSPEASESWPFQFAQRRSWHSERTLASNDLAKITITGPDIATARGSEAERDPKTCEPFTSAYRQELDKEKTVGDKNEEVAEQKQILTHAKPPNTSSVVAKEDDLDECVIANREFWTPCSCGNLVWVDGNTFCEVCTADEDERKGIAESRDAETERDLKRDECLAREDRMPLAQTACGEKQGFYVGLVNPSTRDVKVVDDEVWGVNSVEPREPWVDCLCGNPVETRSDTLCEVCRLLGVRRGIEIARIGRLGVAVEGDKDF